jgi:uncharacterized membrane protein YfcA
MGSQMPHDGPMPIDPSVLLLCISTGMVFLAGLLRGFTGFGFSIAAVPLLSLVRPPVQVIPAVLMLQFAVSLSGLRPALRQCDWASIRLLAVGAVLVTPMGAWALAWLPANTVRLAIAFAVTVAVIALGRGRRLASVPSWYGTLACGAVSGLFNGIAGMPGPPVIAYYLASPAATSVGRASMIVFFGLTALIALVPMAALGLLTSSSIHTALFGLPAVWAGSWLGGRLYGRSSEAGYRGVGLLVLAVTAVLAVLRTMLGH